MKKKIVLWLMLFVATISFVSCKGQNKVTTLDTPTNLVVENQFISFDEVANASYYMINYDGNTITVKPSGTGEIIFDANKILGEAKTYEIKVKAIGTGNYADSSYSAVKKYTRFQVFDAPNVKINSQILTWTAIEDAKHYTIKVTYPNDTQGIYTYSSNSFDIKPLLSSVGYYKFQVKVGQEADDNDYSPEVSYLYEKQLDTPNNIKLVYDNSSNEVYLYFVADKNSYAYTINVNGVDYNLSETYLDTYLEKVNYQNLNKVKLLAFLQSQNVETNNLNSLAVTVSSKSSTKDYYKSSDRSAKTYLEIKKVLTPTTARLVKTTSGGILSWDKVAEANSYIIYKNLEYFATLKKDSTSLVLTNEQLNNNIFNVQVEGVDGLLNSIISNCISSSSLLTKPTINFDNGVISWNEIPSVNKYLLEVYNDTQILCVTLNADDLRFDLNNIIPYNKYNVRLTYITTENKVSGTASININYSKTLESPKNITVGNDYSRYVVNFDKVDGAIGYAVKLNGSDIETIYTNTTIDLTDYILVAGKYNLKIKAIAPFDSNINDSDWVDVGNIQHAVKLSKPQIRVIIDGDRYILKIDKVENAEKYNVLINYISIYDDGVEYDENGYDISSYFTSAQRYSVMVKAVASKSNITYIDSDYNSITVPKYVQLDTINGDKITVTNQEGKYFIEFTTQTHAANYDIRFLNVTTGAEQLININSVPFDITNYVRDKGSYRIYVRAMANSDLNYLYLSSAESGNPYLLDKGKETLAQVTNIEVGEKSTDDSNIMLTWAKVENADSYYLNIYYQRLASSSMTFVQELNVTTNKINLDDYLSKEGKYIFKIKAVSNGDYESSSFVTSSYNYTLNMQYDFMRYKIFMNGAYYSHYIMSYEQLKNIMWYYYLFNNVEYYESNDSYRFKIMLGITIDELEQDCKKANPSFEKAEGEGVDERIRLHIVAGVALSSYNEGFYLENNQFPLPDVVSLDDGNIVYYKYDFVCGLKNDRTDEIVKTSTIKKFDQKSNELPTILQRKDNNVFKIDVKPKIDVSTTEQLFMVVQYDKSPNFVGDCAVALQVYNNCRAVLNSIINDSMTDYEKVEAIYDWLVANVEYNDEFAILMRTNNKFSDTVAIDSEILMGDCKYNYLEGVFLDPENRSATADGFAKAFVLMCKMEGIDAIKVNGTKDGYAHFWNKVFLDVSPNNDVKDPAWFSVDITSSFRQISIDATDYFVPTHRYFLVTDTVLMNNNLKETSIPKNVQSTTEGFNFYNNTHFYYKKYMYVSQGGGVIKFLHEGSGTLQYDSTNDVGDYVKNVIKYMVTICQENADNYSSTSLINMYAIEIDMSTLHTTLDSIVKSITADYYNEISRAFNCSFKIYAEGYDSNDDGINDKILIAIKP